MVRHSQRWLTATGGLEEWPAARLWQGETGLQHLSDMVGAQEVQVKSLTHSAPLEPTPSAGLYMWTMQKGLGDDVWQSIHMRHES